MLATSFWAWQEECSGPGNWGGDGACVRETGREGGHGVNTSFSPAAAARWSQRLGHHMRGPALQGGCLPHRMPCSSPSWPGWRWKP